MDRLKDKLSTLGAFLSAAGLLSSLLAIVNHEVRILAWINRWGALAGWTIRLGLILGGLAVFQACKPAKSRTAPVAPEPETVDWDAYYRGLLSDPLFSRFLGQVRGKYPISFQAIADAEAYRVAHLQLSNVAGKVVPPGARDVYLANVYLERNGDRERLLVGATLREGAWGGVLTKKLSTAEWSGYVPADTSPDFVSTAAKMAPA